jgi:DNA polymerase
MLQWDGLNAACSNCYECDLGRARQNIVIGRGSTSARVMFIGEGPGEQEDLQGLPFVGPAGKLLDLLLESLMFEQEDYYIANVVKCRHLPAGK